MKLFTSPGLLAQIDATIADANRRGDVPSHIVVEPFEWHELNRLMRERGANISIPSETTGRPVRYFKAADSRDMCGFRALGKYRDVWFYCVDSKRYIVE
ncbi:hypothetical protein [Cupriavidus nantongensis]|uniref:Uncharacterized protein n=1 Tax=Cupriavidus nantongensis TaxID=1796606 RepID=A0A142JMX3_9BURK|nr:hypothetical protein [Cupriavidus nantongensis]AMR79435.1 hypothetical protein A2G96_17755 [Cupriavidus nantongensis]